MIISASRRTDIPALYSAWLFKRLEEGYALVRNPMNHRQVSRVSLAPADVDGIVFWSKNPAPMLPHLAKLGAYMYYFLFSLNAYDATMESGLPPLAERIDTFRRLADAIGPQRVLWRYSPILTGGKYSPAWHADAFDRLARQLEGCIGKCIISFLDFYPKIKRSMADLAVTEMPSAAKYRLAGQLAQSAAAHGMRMDADACKEMLDFTPLGIRPARCIDGELLARLGGKPCTTRKDPGQPAKCNCAISADIGVYSTCANGCRYCYANSGVMVRPTQLGRYDANAPMLCGNVEPGDIIKDRRAGAGRKTGGAQPDLFEHK